MSFASPRQFLAELSVDFTLRLLERPEVSRSASEALSELGRWNKRACPLRPLLVVWLVICMSVFRSLSIPNVFRRILDAAGHGGTSRLVTPEALLHARRRLGHEVLAMMFRKMVAAAQPAKRLVLGLRPCGIDGVHFTAPDTPENRREFGKKAGGRGAAAFPQLLGVCLVDLGSRRIADCRFGGCNGDERDAATDFILNQLGRTELVMLDRGIASYRVLTTCAGKSVNYLVRISSAWKPQRLRALGIGDELVRLAPSNAEKQKARLAGVDLPRELVARLICYRVGDATPVRLLTNLLDPSQYPSRELAIQYHRRWECEIVYKELKNELSSVGQGKPAVTFRSKCPEGVLQEAWAMMLAYNLIRELMVEAAAKEGIDPLEISFTDSLQTVKMMLPRLQQASVETRDEIRAQLLEQIAGHRNPRSRRKRAYPRVVKRKMSNFRLKRRHHCQQRRDYVADLVLVGFG